MKSGKKNDWVSSEQERMKTKRERRKEKSKNIVLYLLYYIWIDILCGSHKYMERNICQAKDTHNGMYIELKTAKQNEKEMSKKRKR